MKSNLVRLFSNNLFDIMFFDITFAALKIQISFVKNKGFMSGFIVVFVAILALTWPVTATDVVGYRFPDKNIAYCLSEDMIEESPLMLQSAITLFHSETTKKHDKLIKCMLLNKENIPNKQLLGNRTSFFHTLCHHCPVLDELQRLNV